MALNVAWICVRHATPAFLFLLLITAFAGKLPSNISQIKMLVNIICGHVMLRAGIAKTLMYVSFTRAYISKKT